MRLNKESIHNPNKERGAADYQLPFLCLNNIISLNLLPCQILPNVLLSLTQE